MPTYEYRCPACGFSKDVLMGITDDQWTEIRCWCQQNMLFRDPDVGTATHFKGAGFYETDYKNKT